MITLSHNTRIIAYETYQVDHRLLLNDSLQLGALLGGCGPLGGNMDPDLR